MRIVVGLLLVLAGCFAELRGSSDLGVRVPARASRGAHVGLAVGAGYADRRQIAAVLFGATTTPLDPADVAAPGILMAGARYERSFTARRPELRWYTRAVGGGNICRAFGPKMDPADTTCAGPDDRRGAGYVSLGAGIALAKTYEADLFIPTVVGASAGLVYTHAYDAALGGADFLGLELSFLVGGDYLGELVRRGADN